MRNRCPDPGRLPVLHLLAPQATGGLERTVELIAGGLVGRGYPTAAVLLLDPRGSPPPVVAGLEAAGVTIRQVRAPRRFYWREVRAVEHTIAATGAVILHTHGYRADVLGYLAGKSAGCAVVSTVHGFTGLDLKNRFYEWLDRQVLRRFDAVLAVSAALAGQLIRAGVPPPRVHIVENSIGPPDFLPRNEARRALGLELHAPCVGWVGRMTYEKGVDLAVQALQPLAAAGVQVVLVGDGPARARLERSAGEGFRWAGMVPRASRYLAAFDVLVLTSRTEGTPLVILEAMQAGVPVAAFAVGGVPALLADEAGTLVPPLDVEALGRAVRCLLDRGEEASRQARIAQQVVQQRFGLDPWLDRIEAVYRDVVRNRHSGP